MGWSLIRQVILNRDNYKCFVCKKGHERLHVHHIDGSGEGYINHRISNNDYNNLVTLCHKCHNKIHRKSDIAFRIWGEITINIIRHRQIREGEALKTYRKQMAFQRRLYRYKNVSPRCPKRPHLQCITTPCTFLQ